MQFIFTEIDRNDPETPFFFFVKVEGDDRKYTGRVYVGIVDVESMWGLSM